MESFDEKGIIDLMENRKLSRKQARSVLKERYPSGQVFHLGLRKFVIENKCILKNGN